MSERHGIIVRCIVPQSQDQADRLHRRDQRRAVARGFLFAHEREQRLFAMLGISVPINRRLLLRAAVGAGLASQWAPRRPDPGVTPGR